MQPPLNTGPTMNEPPHDQHDELLLAALASGIPWWLALEAVASVRLSHADSQENP